MDLIFKIDFKCPKILYEYDMHMITLQLYDFFDTKTLIIIVYATCIGHACLQGRKVLRDYHHDKHSII